MEKPDFRYGSRKEYEEALASLVPNGKRKKLKQLEKLDEEYERLVEEYLRFCDTVDG
jgi:hypothetical protein